MNSTIETSLQESEYPAVELAYPIALGSYEALTKRLDSLDGKLQTTLNMFVTMCLAFVSLAGARGVKFNSGWFLAIAIIFAVSITVGLTGRLVGKIDTIHPLKLFNDYLGNSPWEFKKDMIWAAGQSFTKNSMLLERRWRYCVALTVFLVVQAVVMTAWVFLP
jgi:hypothetical protein